MILRYVSAWVVLCMTVANVQAQESAAAAHTGPPWSGKAALGYLATSGNSESSSLNSKFELAYSAGDWQHRLEAAAISAHEDEDSTAEAYALGLKSEYAFSEKNYLFGRAVWRRDRFSGYDQQFAQTVGYGRQLIDTTAHQLTAEVGVGARQSERRDGTMEDEVILSGGASYQWKFSEAAAFTQDLAVESGEANTYIESVSAIKTNLFSELALVASYTIKNNSDVTADTEKTDTYTALSIEYAF